jgi:SAM-dependent methyltransferase
MNPAEGATSPYAHRERGTARQRLSDLKFAAAYSIWRRMIRRYRRGPDPTRFLEVGCGPGNFIHCLHGWFGGARVTAIELDRVVVKNCAARHPDAGFVRGSSEILPFRDGCFEVLSALQVIEHFESPERFLAEAFRVLEPDGLLLLSTPNTRGLSARWLGDAWMGIRDDHISLRSPDEWRQNLLDAGFTPLSEGTTLLAGLPIVGRPPVSLPLQAVQAWLGWFPWRHGESYMTVARRGRPQQPVG